MDKAMHSEIPQWVIDYNNAGHQSSAGKAVGILMKENQSLRSELQKQKELDRVNLNLTFQLVIQNELNGQLIKHLEIMATRLANMIDEKEGCPIEDDEVSEAFALIKKSKES